jgi:hypothetical protein
VVLVVVVVVVVQLKATMNETLISKHMETIQASFLGFLREEKLEDMRRVYYLLSRIADGLTHTAKTYEEYLTKHVGFAIVDAQKAKSPKDAVTSAIPFIKSLIDMHRKYNDLVVNTFSNHVTFKAAFDKVSLSLSLSLSLSPTQAHIRMRTRDRRTQSEVHCVHRSRLLISQFVCLCVCLCVCVCDVCRHLRRL